jgi:hypothetical protein
MRISRFFAVIAGLLASLSACTLITSLDGLSGGVPQDRLDAGALSEADIVTDGARETSSSLDSGDEAGPDLEPQGTFETSTCSPWQSFRGTLVPSSIAHSGAGSCKVCIAAGGAASFTADDERSPGPAVVGATYRVEAWVRADPTAPAPPSLVLALRVATIADGGFQELESHLSLNVAPDPMWRRVESTLEVTKAGMINAFLAAEPAANACFLFDDVAIRRLN